MKRLSSMIIYRLIIAIIFVTTLSMGCKHKPVSLSFENYKNEIDSVGIVLVPDLREGIFEVELKSTGSGLVLKGETNVPEAREGVLSVLKSKHIEFTDSLMLLPDTTVIKKPWGLVNVSVCNIRLFSSYDAEMVSQAVMGTPLKILKKDNGWLLIQTPDNYLGWVDSDAIEDYSQSAFNSWKRSTRIFYTGKTGDIFTDRSETKVVSDIVGGCIAVLKDRYAGMYEITLPDGRDGFIPSEKAIQLDQLTADSYLKTENLIATAESFMGIPYLWGGTSSKGFDCSGFIKTIFYLNGVILSRDASQQFRNGTRVRVRRETFPDSLKKGDLLFFGQTGRGRARATHVGMYIGNSEFIHASGMVKINSLDSTRNNFSRSRRDTFIGARRIIGSGNGNGIKPVLEHGWYKTE